MEAEPVPDLIEVTTLSPRTLDPEVITAENYANLIRSSGLTRSEIATPEGQATEAIKVLISPNPIMVKVSDETWALICPDIKYAQFLAVDQNWLNVLAALEEIEAVEDAIVEAEAADEDD